MRIDGITPEHYGWVVGINDPSRLLTYREIYLVKHSSQPDRVGLVDALGAARFTSSRIIGTETWFASDTPCQALRRWRKR